jgi:hypothetical protein
LGKGREASFITAVPSQMAGLMAYLAAVRLGKALLFIAPKVFRNFLFDTER